MQTYPSGGGGYKEQYYTVVEEVDYVVKDDYHYNKGSNVQMMKPATNHSYDDHNKHAHQSYGEYDLHNKNGHNKGYGGYDDHNKHAHQSYGGYDLHNKNGHNKGYGGYDDYDMHMNEGYGGYDQNTHGYGGSHNNRNKYGGGGCSAAKYSETWYEKEKRNGNDDWNMKNKQHIGNNDQHNAVGFTNGGYWANQGPPVPRCPVWQSKGIDD